MVSQKETCEYHLTASFHKELNVWRYLGKQLSILHIYQQGVSKLLYFVLPFYIYFLWKTTISSCGVDTSLFIQVCFQKPRKTMTSICKSCSFWISNCYWELNQNIWFLCIINTHQNIANQSEKPTNPLVMVIGMVSKQSTTSGRKSVYISIGRREETTWSKC